MSACRERLVKVTVLTGKVRVFLKVDGHCIVFLSVFEVSYVDIFDVHLVSWD